MSQLNQSNDKAVSQSIEIAIRLVVILLIVMWCARIISPFISLVVWGGIIAVAIYSPFLKLVDKLGGRKKSAAVLLAVVMITVVLVPVISLSGSLIESSTELGHNISEGSIHIPAPSEDVKTWPLIGDKTYEFWHQASSNLSGFIKQYSDQFSTIGLKLVSALAGAGAGILQFIISMLIAAVFLVSAEAIGRGMNIFFQRMAGDHGESLLNLSTATVRSVAVGVIGIAFIQAILGGLGMMFADVPAAGLLAVVILVLAIAQLPPLLVLLPVVVYVFSEQTTTVAMIFMVWSLLVSVSDAFLKPLLLGRGVDAPMLVILLGAIGGMILSGIVGLFVGAVVLALGYKLFQAWLEMPKQDMEK